MVLLWMTKTQVIDYRQIGSSSALNCSGTPQEDMLAINHSNL